MYQVGINNKEGMHILLKVSNKIKSIISSVDMEYLKNILNSHYRTLHLIDNNGKWMTEKLNNISNKLVPEDLNETNLNIFIDEITMLCTKNNYLMNFFKDCNNKSFEKLEMKFESEGEKVIIDVVVYAFMLGTLSNECIKDHLILQELYHCFSINRNKLKSFKNLPLLQKIKLISVERSIRSYLKCHKNKAVKSGFGSLDVSKNIFEFICVDLLGGVIGNVKAGFTLFNNRCGLTDKDESTGAGPSKWSKDEKIIEHVFPLSESWTNLYQVWSMCLSVNSKDFPYSVSSFLIPEVLNYYSNPHKYIYNMNIAVYIYINFLSFSYGNQKINGEGRIDWKDRNLRKIFATSNKKSAEIYNEKLKKAKE